MTAAALVWCPFPDAETGRAAANTLLDDGLVACANMLPGMRSLFVWQGERSEAEETGILFKTEAALLDRVIARLEQIHPYDAPAILGWQCDAASPATIAWLGALAT